MGEPSLSRRGANAEAPTTGFSSGTQAAAALPLPRVFGRLLLLKLIARGGMGDVYLAATTGIEGAERACVVKTIRRDHIHDGSFLARFLDEARVQSQLNHPGVAQVLEAATDENGEPYTVVEHVEGRSLSEVRQRAIQLGKKIEWPDAVACAIEMAQALAHVHERSGSDGSPLQIVHRDLSPQNVMIGYSGEVKLIDFGTARGHNRRCHTVAGVVFAKPGYVAPEVARQQVGDGRIDVYALGIMLWELCSARRFFSGSDPQKHLEEAAAGKVLVPAVANNCNAPALLDDIVQRLTANDPEERYASAAQAVPDLAKLLGMAPASKTGERGVRARVANVMRMLWPSEPGNSRAEFAKLLREARELRPEVNTPNAAKVVENVASRMAPDDPYVLAGTPYRLARKIGEGASGIVYEAEHVELGRRLAIKVLAPEHASATDAVERFRREARAVAKLSHPNLVGLYDFGKSLDGRVFLAMELLRGDTLDKRLKKESALSWREAAKLAIEVCKALEAAHGAKLVHRDLKPANLFLTDDGVVKLLDFGVAMALADTIADANEKRQKGFAIFGTPEYMSPEQVAGEAVDGRCDLYSLGCVLYEMVTGLPVFDGPSAVVVMGKQLRETPESPRMRAPARVIPHEINDVIVQALAKAPRDRFATAAAMRMALESSLDAPDRRRAASRRTAKTVLMVTALIGVAGATAHWGVPRFVASKWAQLSTEPAPTPVAAMARPAPLSDVPPETPVSVLDPESLAMPTTAATSTSTPTPSDAPEAATKAERARVLADFRLHAKQHMSDPASLRAWAWAAYRAGEFREARRAANAWSLHDGTAEPRVFLAGVLETSGHRAEAKAVLDEWLQIHPDSLEAKKALARLSGDHSAKPQLARK
jgi:serine/threonine-protein kinase